MPFRSVGLAAWLLIAWLLAMPACLAAAPPDDHAALAQRFRPYYRFSADNLGVPGVPRFDEPVHPASWQWFVAHSILKRGSNVIRTNAELARNQLQILNVSAEADVRTTVHRNAPYTLEPLDTRGEPWADVVGTGAGLYAQVEELDNDMVLLVYWTLYPFNRSSRGPAFEHRGDITGVAVVYDRRRGMLVRATTIIHGPVIESFDLQAPASRRIETLAGRHPDGSREFASTTVLSIAADHRYQDGPWWHSPSRPSDVYFARDPQSGRYDHLVLFVEWGTHEVWLNAHGSVFAAPTHSGSGISFLPARVRYLGSAARPVASEAPFFFFNGKWGDPPSPVFHLISAVPRTGMARSIVPDDQMIDRDPYLNAGLSWPPGVPVTARIAVTATGDRDDAQVAIRWGHPDFDEHEYFPLWIIRRGNHAERTVTLSEISSELEIQTEGGEGTGYDIRIWVDTGLGQPAAPSIVLRHRIGTPTDWDIVANNVSAGRSSPLNKYGEQNIRIDTQHAAPGPIN